jgi:hypothetical protein
MKFDAVKTGFLDGRFRRSGIGSDDARKLAKLQRAGFGRLLEAACAVRLDQIGLGFRANSGGATGLPPFGCSEVCEMRPTCQSCATILPPAACTASVTLRQPANCSGA